MASLSDLMKAKATAMASSTVSQVATLDMNMIDNSIPAYSGEEYITSEPVAAYSGEMTIGDNFVRSDKYLWYEEYYDDKYSTIDENKNIKINQN